MYGRDPARQVCFDYTRRGNCRRGDSCRFSHTASGIGAGADAGFGPRPSRYCEARGCNQFVRPGDRQCQRCRAGLVSHHVACMACRRPLHLENERHWQVCEACYRVPPHMRPPPAPHHAVPPPPPPPPPPMDEPPPVWHPASPWRREEQEAYANPTTPVYVPPPPPPPTESAATTGGVSAGTPVRIDGLDGLLSAIEAEGDGSYSPTRADYDA